MATVVVGVGRERVAPAQPVPPPPGVDVESASDPVAPAPAVPPTTRVAVHSAGAESDFLWELRKYVLLLATLAATVTYSAGLSPPGGFWPDNVEGSALLAGDPVLPVTYPRRYKAFFYCNATAFVASLVIVNLLLVRSLCHRRRWLRALQAAMMLDQFGLMGAYAAGSCRDEAMSAYVFVLVALAVAEPGFSNWVCGDFFFTHMKVYDNTPKLQKKFLVAAKLQLGTKTNRNFAYNLAV